MELGEIIKTKNGLAFLGNNKELIPAHYQRLTREIPQFQAEIDYGKTEFSYKKHVRKFTKEYHISFQRLINELKRLCADYQANMANVLATKRLDFDGDFLAINKEGEISYMPYNKVQKMVNNDYAKTGRQKITIHKFVAKIFKNDKRFTEQQIKDFAEHIKSIAVMELRIEFLKGEEIGKFYEEVDNVGWARGSCMAKKPEYPAKRFTIYMENCELGVIMNGNIPVGRFLRWQSTNGTFYEDSMYYKTASVKSWYDQRCKNENITFYGMPNMEKLTFTLKRPLKAYHDDERPGYFDSIKFHEKEPIASNKYLT